MSEQVTDLSALLPTDTGVLHIVVPGTSKRTGWEITFAGPGHKQTVDAVNAQARRNLARAARIEAQQLNGRKIKPEDRTVEEQRRENVEWIVSRIIDWTPIKIAKVSPDPIKFDPSKATELLSLPEMGPYYLQMVEFLGNEGSFIESSAND